MQEAWVPGALTMIFGTLFGLQGVSSNETVNNCEDLWEGGDKWSVSHSCLPCKILSRPVLSHSCLPCKILSRPVCLRNKCTLLPWRTVNPGLRHCPKGFRCCGNECCHESKILDPENDPLKIVVITLLVIIVLLCICGLVMSKCKRLPHDLRTADHQTPPDAPPIAPLESIWVTSLDPLPTYSQVVLNSTPTEPPPPYSLRPERPTGQRRGTRYATI